MSSSAKPNRPTIGLKTIDFMGTNFNLNFNTISGKFQTHLGGSITILMGIISVGAFYMVMSQYFDRSKPVVTTSSEIGSRTLEFNLYKEMLFTPVGIYLGTQYIRSDWDRYITVKAYVRNLVLNSTTYRMQITPFLEFDYIPCSQSTDPVVKEFMVTADTGNAGLENIYLCPDFKGKGDEFRVLDDLQTLEFKVAFLDIYPCSLPNPADCASEREIRSLGVDILPVTKLLETADYDDPIRNFVVKRYNELDPSLIKNLKFDLRNSKVVDDASRFSEPVIKKRFSEAFHRSTDFTTRDGSIYCHPLMIRTARCPQYIKYNFQGVGDVGIIRRNYRKWTEMLGEFGGIIKVVSSTAFAFYAFYNIFMMKSYLGRVVLGSNQKDHKEATELLKKQQKAVRVNLAKISGVSAKTALQAKNLMPTQKEVMQEMLRTRTDVDNLIGKLNTIELLEQILFGGNEEVKKLIPLVLYQKAQKDLELQKAEEKNKKKKRESQASLNTNQITPITRPSNQRIQKKKKGPSSLKDCYKQLQGSKLDDSFRNAVKEYMLDYLDVCSTQRAKYTLQARFWTEVSSTCTQNPKQVKRT